MSALHRELDTIGGGHVPVIEDCAQAFEGPHEHGHPRSLAALFSFGPIKSSTALGGCLARISGVELRDRMCARAARYPPQRRRDYLQIVAKYAALKAMSTPRAYASFVQLCALVGRSHDQVINSAVLGLQGDNYWAALRRRPAPALLTLLDRRMRRFDGDRINRRREHGEQLAARLGHNHTILGADAEHRSWWQFAIHSDDPERLITRLRSAGFDATAGSSRLGCPTLIDGQADPCPRARAAMASIVYVPVYPELPAEALARLAEHIAATDGHP
jgi:dTDP-4-amino-4,6-dideoxygalactose transaminase